VPLIITQYAGKLTPQARVAVVTKTRKCPSKNIASMLLLSLRNKPALCIPTLFKQISFKG